LEAAERGVAPPPPPPPPALDRESAEAMAASLMRQAEALAARQRELAALQAETVAHARALLASAGVEGAGLAAPLLPPPLPPPATPPPDSRGWGGFDARFHSTSSAATPADLRVLPKRIILVRHAESEGNIEEAKYTVVPDPSIGITARGVEQAHAAGNAIRQLFEDDGEPYKLHFFMSPYKRSRQTADALISCLDPATLAGAQEEIQLREQDFGNFQDARGKAAEKAERLRYGRFFYRFPNGESGADVYDRITQLLDHLVRDINAGAYAPGTSLVLVTHGLALRIFLMRFMRWTVDEFLQVWNPRNCEPIIIERTISPLSAGGGVGGVGGLPSSSSPSSPSSSGVAEDPASLRVHTRALYRLAPESMRALKGVTPEMCYLKRPRDDGARRAGGGEIRAAWGGGECL
jgi:broad specificity phosphatase PhoE